MLKFLVIVSTTVLGTVLSYPFNACIGKCPESKNPCKNPTLLAHQDCTKYCFCNDECPTVKKCPGNFHFSLDESMCLPVELAKCDDRRNCLGICPIVWNTDNVLLLPHSNSSKFCHCREWGVPIIKTCPESLVFNSQYGQCVKPDPDCHHQETEAPTVGSTDIVVPTTLPPIFPIVLGDPEYLSNVWLMSTSADSVSEHETTAAVNGNDATTIFSIGGNLYVNNKDETTGSAEEQTTVAGNDAVTNEPKIEGLNTTASNIDDATTTEAAIKGSSTVCSCQDNGVPDNKNLVTDAPNYDDSTTLKSKIDVIIPTVAPKIEDSTTLKTDVDVIIPTVASTSKLMPVEMTAEPKTENPTTSNDPKLSIVPCNCTQTVFSDTNLPIIKEKVHIDDYFSSNVEHCIGLCPRVNVISRTTHLPHLVCTQYCTCDWGKPTVMKCPDDLHFNRKLQVCDYPMNANCSGIRALTNC